jgi:uncharacterized protein
MLGISDGGRLVIDAHHHVGLTGQPSIDEDWAAQDIDSRRQFMRQMGLDRFVVLPAPGSAGGFRNVDHATMNDSVAKYARLAGEIVEAVAATVNPAEGRAACHEMERAFTALAMDAVAFHHRFLGMTINDRRMDDLMKVAGEHDRTVFVHIISDSTLEAAWRLLSLARRFPEVRFIALDGFSSASQAAMLREWAPDVPNVWFDTGAMISVAHGLDAFIESCGPERLLLGTDFYSGAPHFRRAYPIDELAAMQLPAEALDLICGKNIQGLMRHQ